MEKILYVTDLDGTLMRDDKTISEETVAILNRLIDRGIYVTYATARSMSSASVITRDIHFPLPAIIRNGTILADARTGEELDPLYQLVKESLDWICVYQKDKYRPEYWLEICPREATKAKAIQKLQRQYGCSRVVVFGDSLNDISMFEIADEAYAVANAMEELKTIATEVIGDNNSDGVARWLERRYNHD